MADRSQFSWLKLKKDKGAGFSALFSPGKLAVGVACVAILFGALLLTLGKRGALQRKYGMAWTDGDKKGGGALGLVRGPRGMRMGSTKKDSHLLAKGRGVGGRRRLGIKQQAVAIPVKGKKHKDRPKPMSTVPQTSLIDQDGGPISGQRASLESVDGFGGGSAGFSGQDYGVQSRSPNTPQRRSGSVSRISSGGGARGGYAGARQHSLTAASGHRGGASARGSGSGATGFSPTGEGSDGPAEDVDGSTSGSSLGDDVSGGGSGFVDAGQGTGPEGDPIAPETDGQAGDADGGGSDGGSEGGGDAAADNATRCTGLQYAFSDLNTVYAAGEAAYASMSGQANCSVNTGQITSYRSEINRVGGAYDVWSTEVPGAATSLSQAEALAATSQNGFNSMRADPLDPDDDCASERATALAQLWSSKSMIQNTGTNTWNSIGATCEPGSVNVTNWSIPTQ